MSENIFSKLCLISSLPISACFYTYMSIFCPFYAVMILASLFSDKLASSLQTRRPVRFLLLSPVYLYAFMPPSRIWHALFLSCGGVLYRLHFLQRFSNCSATTVDPSHRHVGIVYVNRNSPAELFHACRHVYALHLFRVCGTSWGGKHVVRLCNKNGACWPVFLDRHSIPVVCAEAFSMFDHSYLIIRVLRFLCFHAHSYRPLDRSLGMSYLAVTFPCQSFFLGSGIAYITFPYPPPPYCRRFSVYRVGKTPTMRLFWMFSR